MLAQIAWRSRTAKRVALLSALCLAPALGVLTAFGIAPDTALEKVPVAAHEEAIRISLLENAEGGAGNFYHRQDKVQRGDSVAAILARLDVADQAAFDFLRRDAASAPLFRQLRPGKAVHAKTGSQGELHDLRYFLSPEKFLHVERRPDGFSTTEKSYAETTHRAYKSGSIRSSLFAATDSAGIPDAVAMQIARIFSTDIDFHIDLRKGDRFSVVYELVSAQGEPVRAGDVLYAEFVNNGRTYEAFRFTDNEGQSGYYSRDGQNRAKSFLRSPLEFSRVSSGFGSRLHPIFKNWRAHTGVDFAAPSGTRVWSTADGVIEFAGVKGGYGKCIEVRHSGGITTLYAHLSGFAPQTKRGARVRQGELIGFVGRTGYATGPHLHYEFKVSGMHQDPMRVALPKAEPLPARLKAAFEGVAIDGAEKLAALRIANAAEFE